MFKTFIYMCAWRVRSRKKLRHRGGDVSRHFSNGHAACVLCWVIKPNAAHGMYKHLLLYSMGRNVYCMRLFEKAVSYSALSAASELPVPAASPCLLHHGAADNRLLTTEYVNGIFQSTASQSVSSCAYFVFALGMLFVTPSSSTMRCGVSSSTLFLSCCSTHLVSCMSCFLLFSFVDVHLCGGWRAVNEVK